MVAALDGTFGQVSLGTLRTVLSGAIAHTLAWAAALNFAVATVTNDRRYTMIEVHVEGRIELGRLSEFHTGVQRYCEYLRTHGYVTPRVLHGMSGPMNTIRLVYEYPSVDGYLRHEQNSMADPEYGKAASGMPFVDGTLQYIVYHPLDEKDFVN